MKLLSNTQQEERLLAISMWRESGLSQGAFCKREGISRSTFQHWRKRLDPTYERMTKPKQKKPDRFYSIEVDEDAKSLSSSGVIEVSYPNGVILKCSDSIPVNQLSKLIHLPPH